jgi:hypothetical protein
MARESMYGLGDSASLGREWFAAQRARIARMFCDDAAAQPTSLLLEQWASMMLGWFWNRRRRSGRRGRDSLLLAGEPILRSVAEVGSADAKLALLTIARIERGPLGRRARQLADDLVWPVPARIEDVGTARLVRAFHGSSPGDAEVVVFETDGTGPREHMLVLYIDERHHRIAKHVFLLRRFDPLRPETSPWGRELPLEFDAADLAPMRRKARQAVRRTDNAANPPVDETFTNYRAIALARLDPLES